MFRRNPFDDMLDSLLNDFKTMFRDYDEYGNGVSSIRNDVVYDVWEDDNQVYLNVELPGIDKKDIDLRVDTDEIELKVQINEEEKSHSKSIRSFKRASMQIYKKIALPAEIKVNQAKATYKNGVLEIVAPKAKPGTSRKKINIE